ncbi:MAG: glycosyltransferase [Algoriphagus sp.]|nr:glycosyltransferase [Algoriphagus sp.]
MLKKKIREAKVITISPSGNLYGSENVLFDYLLTTKLNHIVFVPKNSQFQQKLQNQNWDHHIIGFNPKSLEFFYAFLFLFILSKQITSVYINEGGHYKWIKWMAMILPKTKFTVHLRMVYDARIDRIGQKIPKNIRLLAISHYVAEELKNNEIEVEVVYDGFINNITSYKFPISGKKIKVGIIGRISVTKGIHKFYELIDELKKRKQFHLFEFHFYGSNHLSKGDSDFFFTLLKDNPSIHFHDFQTPETVFKSIDLVIHFNKEEGLGRIFLESIANGLPFIGYNTSGISEVGEILGLQHFLIEGYQKDDTEELTKLLVSVAKNLISIQESIYLSQKKLSNFDIYVYVKKLDLNLLKSVI